MSEEERPRKIRQHVQNIQLKDVHSFVNLVHTLTKELPDTSSPKDTLSEQEIEVASLLGECEGGEDLDLVFPNSPMTDSVVGIVPPATDLHDPQPSDCPSYCPCDAIHFVESGEEWDLQFLSDESAD